MKNAGAILVLFIAFYLIGEFGLFGIIIVATAAFIGWYTTAQPKKHKRRSKPYKAQTPQEDVAIPLEEQMYGFNFDDDTLAQLLQQIPSTETETETPTVHESTGGLTTCPIPGCGKKVRRMWNHLFQYHKKTGQFTGKWK